MSEWYWLGLAWLAFGMALWMVLARRRGQQLRHYPYEPRAELLRAALAEKRQVRFLYWSQAEERWLHRRLTPLSLATGHLRAEDSQGHSRRYEVSRMRVVRVGRRCVRPAWRWQVPLAGLLGTAAVSLSSYALWQNARQTQLLPVGRNTTAMQWWQNTSTSMPARLPAQPTATNTPPPLTTVTANTQALVETQAEAPSRNESWQVLMEHDPSNNVSRAVGVLQSVFLHARPQAIFLVRQAEIQGQVTVWSGSAQAATNYVDELRRLGLKASVLPPRP